MKRDPMAVVGLLLVLAMAGSCDDADAGPSGDGGATSTQSCAAPPEYSSDCAEVGYFECGFMATCDGATITAEWHVHHFCGDVEDIISYSCTYDCPAACDASWSDWPQDGAELVAGMCTSGGSGGAGGGSVGGGGTAGESAGGAGGGAGGDAGSSG